MPAVLIDLPGYDEDALKDVGHHRAPDPSPPHTNLPMTSKTATRFLYLAFGLFIVASMTFFVMQTTAAFQELTHRGEHARMSFQVDDDLLTINNLEHEAIAAGLKDGDRLLEIRGVPYRGNRQIVALNGGGKDFIHAGDALSVMVRRVDGSVHRAEIHTVGGQRSQKTFNLEWAITILQLLPPIICLLIGYWVVAARIRDPNAWLLLVLFAFPSVLATRPHWWPDPWALPLRAWYDVMQVLNAPALLLFGIYFPERWRVDRRFPWTKWLVLAPMCAGLALYASILYIENFAAPEYGTLSARLSPWVDRTLNPLALICVLIYVAALIDKLRSATTADARRRLQVHTAGSIIGLGSLLLVFVLLPHFGVQPNKHPWIALPAFLLFFAAPFSFAYVVVVQRALDVRLLLRMGTKYALARYTLLVAEFAVVAFVIFHFVLPLVRHRENLPVAIPVLALLAAGLIKLFASHDSISNRLQRWLDRKFFREAYDAELVLSELSDQARRFTEAKRSEEHTSELQSPA